MRSLEFTPRLMGIALVLLGNALWVPTHVSAQDPGRMGSRILSLDSWTYEAIERLRTRGYLSGLNPMVQPYRRIDVAAELVGLDADTLPEPSAAWTRSLRDELTPELERLSQPEDEAAEQRMGVQFILGGTAADSRRRDPLVPYRTTANEGVNDRAWVSWGGGLWLETHNVAAEMRLFKDSWFRGTHGDPDGLNPGGFRFLGRTDNAYLTLAFPWGNIWVGRFVRNWGPIGQTGMMIGDNATSYPQIGLDLGRGDFTYRFMAGELLSAAGRQRYIVGNRLDYRTGNFWVSIGQSALYSGESAVLRLFNPLEFIWVDHSSTYDPRDISGNLMFNATFWGRVGQSTLYGEFALDDFDLNPRIGLDDRGIEATSYQVSLGGRYHGISDGLELGFDYRRVSAWSYRSGVLTETWMHLDRGLGDPWSDFDRLTLRADWYPAVQGLRLSPVFQYQRKGEGDYRIPFPPRDEQLALPGIFHGVLETTKRLAIQGRYQPRNEAFVEWDLGHSFVSNAGHADSSNDRRVSFLLRLGLTLDFPFLRGSNP